MITSLIQIFFLIHLNLLKMVNITMSVEHVVCFKTHLAGESAGLSSLHMLWCVRIYATCTIRKDWFNWFKVLPTKNHVIEMETKIGMVEWCFKNNYLDVFTCVMQMCVIEMQIDIALVASELFCLVIEICMCDLNASQQKMRLIMWCNLLSHSIVCKRDKNVFGFM